MSRCTTAILFVSTCDITRLTKDVFPIRRGDINTTFWPFSKSLFSRLVSAVRSVKFSPSTATPYTKAFFIVLRVLVFRLQRYNFFAKFTTLWTTKLWTFCCFCIILHYINVILQHKPFLDNNPIIDVKKNLRPWTANIIVLRKRGFSRMGGSFFCHVLCF